MKFSFREKAEKILVIDLGNLFYYAKPSNLNDELLAGRFSVVEQFIINLNSYIRIIEPTTVVIADDSISEWRKELYPLYKNRKKTEWTDLDKAHYNNRVELIKVIQEYFPIYYLKIDNIEADDICFLVASKYKDKNVVVMSGDKDLVQLSQKFYNTKIYDPIIKKIVERPELDIVRYKILKGDTSDNIKGFPNIGDKTARIILKTKKTFNTWYKSLSEEQLELYKTLKNIICLDKIPQKYKDEFDELIKNYEFKEFDLHKFENMINEYQFDRINIKYIKENFGNLKKI